MSKTVLGIDVAKKKLDVCLKFGGKVLTKKFDNNTKGFKLLQGWLVSLKIERVHACLEATGSYGEAVAEFLHERGSPRVGGQSVSHQRLCQQRSQAEQNGHCGCPHYR